MPDYKLIISALNSIQTPDPDDQGKLGMLTLIKLPFLWSGPVLLSWIKLYIQE